MVYEIKSNWFMKSNQIDFDDELINLSSGPKVDEEDEEDGQKSVETNISMESSGSAVMQVRSFIYNLLLTSLKV